GGPHRDGWSSGSSWCLAACFAASNQYRRPTGPRPGFTVPDPCRFPARHAGACDVGDIRRRRVAFSAGSALEPGLPLRALVEHGGDIVMPGFGQPGEVLQHRVAEVLPLVVLAADHYLAVVADLDACAPEFVGQPLQSEQLLVDQGARRQLEAVTPLEVLDLLVFLDLFLVLVPGIVVPALFGLRLDPLAMHAQEPEHDLVLLRPFAVGGDAGLDAEVVRPLLPIDRQVDQLVVPLVAGPV